METEAAFKLEQFMRREFGLSPTGVTAELCGIVLHVTLEGAVSPIGRAIAQVDGGKAALANVYDILHDVNRERMHRVVSRIFGAAVHQSMIEADLPTWDVFVTFRLKDLPFTEARHISGAGADMAHSCLE